MTRAIEAFELFAFLLVLTGIAHVWCGGLW